MPEVYVTVESVVVDGSKVSGLTIRLEAEDALLLATDALGDQARLGMPEATDVVVARVLGAVSTGANALIVPVGVEVDGEFVFVYLQTDDAVMITETRILSSVYKSWTNYVRDEREKPAKSRVFTQQGPMTDHHH
ncbi:MAG: hypothetical protein AAGH41_11060 [Pseudomonadota bacterium]